MKAAGCGMQNKGYRVQAVMYRLQEKGCTMWDEVDGCRAQISGCKKQVARSRLQDAG